MEKRPVDVVVLSDVHLGTYGCRAKELVNYLRSITPNILILNGDITDRGLPQDLALARQVLTDFRTYDRTGPVYDRVRGAMGAGLATSRREDHRRQRLLMQPAFRRQHLAGYAALMRKEIAATMSDWRDGQRLDMVAEMFGLTTRIALRALISSRISPAGAENP